MTSRTSVLHPEEDPTLHTVHTYPHTPTRTFLLLHRSPSRPTYPLPTDSSLLLSNIIGRMYRRISSSRHWLHNPTYQECQLSCNQLGLEIAGAARAFGEEV